MSVANPKTSLSVRDQVSKDEWEIRVNLAAAYRLVALYGWDDLVGCHRPRRGGACGEAMARDRHSAESPSCNRPRRFEFALRRLLMN